MLSLAAQWLIQSLHVLQTALGEAVRQEKTMEKDQGVVALAKKAEDLYKQQQEIIKKADKRYTSIPTASVFQQPTALLLKLPFLMYCSACFPTTPIVH